MADESPSIVQCALAVEEKPYIYGINARMIPTLDPASVRVRQKDNSHAGVFWTLGYDTIYAIQDLEDDALAGVKSSARRLGDKARPAVLGFYVISFALAVAAAWAGRLGPLFLPFAGVLAIHLSRQADRVSPSDPEGALRLFRSNRDAGLILFAGLVAGLWQGVGGSIGRFG